MPIEDLVLTHVSISAAEPIEIAYAKRVEFVDCDISAKPGSPVIVHADVTGLK